MSTQTRKARERAQREKLILEIARRLLLENGYAGLTMERVALAAEYSKGTIYNHFSSKEEIVVELASRVLHGKALFLERAAAYKGTSRERLTALGEAAWLFLQVYPEDFQIMQMIQSQLLTRLVSEERRERVHAQELRAFNAVLKVVRDAQAHGELACDFAGDAVARVAFGVYCALDGGLSVPGRRPPLDELWVKDPYSNLSTMIDRLADGFCWRPLSSDADYDEVRRQVRACVFEHESRRLSRLARPSAS